MTAEGSAEFPLRRFLVTASLARTPSEGLALALVLLCVHRDVAASTAGLLVAATSLPQLISGPALGPVLDRLPDIWTGLRLATVVTAAAIAALIAGVGNVPIGLALVAAAVVAVAEPTFTGGISAAADRTGSAAGTALAAEPPDRAPAPVHAWDSFSYNVAGLLAPALVTVVSITAGPASAMVALAACVLSSSLTSIGLRARPRGTQPDGSGPGVRPAVRAIVASRPLRAVTLSTTVAFAGFGGLTFAAVAAARAAGRSANDAGELFTVLAVGGLIGSLVMTRRPAPVRPERTVGWALAAMGAALLAMAATESWAVALAGAAVFGLLDGPLLVGVFAARVQYAPPSLRTTVFTLGASAKLGASAVGAVVASRLLDDRATAAGFALIGALHIVAGGLCRLLDVAR